MNKDDTDMVPVLLELAAGNPEALFFPVFQPVGDYIAEQLPTVDGMGEVQMFSADGLLTAEYLSLPQSVGMYFSGPDTRYGGNVNESTGKTAEEFLNAYQAAYQELPRPHSGHMPTMPPRCCLTLSQLPRMSPTMAY